MTVPFSITLSQDDLLKMVEKNLFPGATVTRGEVQFMDGDIETSIQDPIIVLKGQMDLDLVHQTKMNIDLAY